MIASWTGDGSGGFNVAMPMNNNDWTDFTFPNVSGAQAPNGDFIYTLLITPIDPSVPSSAENVFKVRAKEKLYVPAMIPITFITPFAATEGIEFFVEDILTLYPNATIDGQFASICWLPPGELCDLNDPSCCLFETTYDGMWSFFIEVPPGESALDIWDGDLDYGDLAGTVFDIDDPNTPGDPFLPEWSIGTDVVFETARPAIPNDNNGNSSEVLFVRDPSIQYFVIDPLGNQYQNFNPSGDREWELFRLDTATDDPAIAEFRVDSIAPGLWEVKLIGVDLSNLNLILLLFDLLGEQIDDPGVPRPIPTLNEWGLIVMAGILGIVGFMAIRRRNVTA